jgi:hypothetical protein
LNLTAASSLLKRMVATSRWVFGPAAVLFLIVAGWRARAIFSNVLVQIHPATLIFTVLLWASLHLLTPVFTATVLQELDAPVRYRTVLAIHVGRLPARYLPGGIWHTVTRVMDLHHLGVSRSQLSVMVLLENLVPVAVALTIGGLFLCLAGDAGLPAVAALLGGMLLLACTPLVLRHRAFLHGRKFAFAAYAKITAFISIFWLIAATAFACYWSAFPTTNGGVPLLQVYGAYLLAWAAGFVSIFAPQGIGVFEAVAGVFLRGALPFAGVAVLAAGFRVVILAADMLAYLMLHVLRYSRRAWL